MKKTLLALAVISASGTANAGITVYETEAVKVDFAGAAEIQYIQEYAPDSEAHFRLDDGDLSLNTTIAVSEKINAVAGIAFEMESGDVTSDELWVGLGGDFGTLTFGRQNLFADDSGIAKDYELAGEGIDFVQDNGDQVAKYVFDNGRFYLGAAALLESDGKSTTENQTTIYDGRIGARFNDLDARVYFYSGDNVHSNKFDIFNGGMNVDIDGYNAEVEYTFNDFAFAASFGQVDYQASSDPALKIEVDTAALAGSYIMNKTTFVLGYTYWNPQENGIDDKTYAVYANVTQQLHSNVIVYVEAGHSDLQDSKFAYLAGMEVRF
ncbi:porin [Psychromonas aquimarina]|uniref:porin n=1 Tax=Psychromonas aquimarina TaxID=444919 RepID=UPI0004129836|nr:porin [Psychromonas aquimarina]